MIELKPEAEEIARRLDAERSAGHTRGPLHGIPILLKANIDTGDRMQTTAGSLALLGTPPAQDSTVAENLRRAGAECGSSSGSGAAASASFAAADPPLGHRVTGRAAKLARTAARPPYLRGRSETI